MTDETETDVLDKTESGTDTGTDAAADTNTDKDVDTSADTTDTTGADADPNKSADASADKDPGDKDADKSKADWPDDWRERLAAGDEDIAKIINRYSSPRAIAKALKDAKDTIRSGKLKRDMPDPSDEKAMAEWRKEQGIPDDPSGYELPEDVTKRLTDQDKPLLANFTEWMHSKGATNTEVARASEWYVSVLEDIESQQLQSDTEALETCEDTLRKDWAHGEYKANLTLGKRFMESIPGVGASWTEARLPDGKRLGDIPEFVMWAADMGRERYGDATFANSDSEQRHTARKTEIKKIMATDIDRYYSEGLDKEYKEILERESKRRK